MVYDIKVERVNKILKIARKYLNWVQNSVLEGEITLAKYARLKREVQRVIEEEEDSIIFYIFENTKYTARERIGIEKGDIDSFV